MYWVSEGSCDTPFIKVPGKVLCLGEPLRGERVPVLVICVPAIFATLSGLTPIEIVLPSNAADAGSNL